MAPPMTTADKIRILVASDNHVGYGERYTHRQNDSWQTFEEIMVLAKERDVDMVLLAGDLFHDNKPSRRSMVNVMRVLRTNCLGDKPCELEMLGDQSETIHGYFSHVNYEDTNINVSLPVFSIHGNHDDPYGDGEASYAPLDILGAAGLMNYYGKSLDGDSVKIRPVLMQKGRTKLALYGMGNIRDERLYRYFRDGNVKFFRPSTQQDDWFNIMSVHQNHAEHSPSNYLPEEFLPNFLDMVIWGHEHECKIKPKENYETGFHVMQPGSSVATSLMPGEAVPKHVAILTVTGRDFHVEPIRLKTVRPFVIREIVLMDDPVAKKLVQKDSHRAALTSRLTEIVNEMIEEARQEWTALQEEGDEDEFPRPLIRLRVDHSAPEGSKFDLENTQRFSSAFTDKVANGDILQPHQRKHRKAMSKANSRLPDGPGLEGLESLRVDKLVKEFLDAQTLTIFPQNSFGDAVTQFVDKDDKHAMEMFVSESLKAQVKHLVALDERDAEEEDEEIAEAMATRKEHLEKAFASGALKKTKASRVKPKPDGWDSDMDGSWADQPLAMIFSEDDAAEDDEEDDIRTTKKPAAKGRAKAAAAKKPAAKKATTAKAPARGRKKAAVVSDDEEEMSDLMILDDDEDDDLSDSQALFVTDRAAAKGKKTPAPAKAKAKPAPAKTTRAAATRKTPARAAAAPSQQASISSWARGKSAAPATQQEPEEISSDESDDFEPMKPTKGRR